jgi:hypothetical protein
MSSKIRRLFIAPLGSAEVEGASTTCGRGGQAEDSCCASALLLATAMASAITPCDRHGIEIAI